MVDAVTAELRREAPARRIHGVDRVRRGGRHPPSSVAFVVPPSDGRTEVGGLAIHGPAESEDTVDHESNPRCWAGLGVMCLVLLIMGIDGSIVYVALPSLVRDLVATSSQLRWIVDAYTIVNAGFLLIDWQHRRPRPWCPSPRRTA
jgi:hypothetical protein